MQLERDAVVLVDAARVVLDVVDLAVEVEAHHVAVRQRVLLGAEREARGHLRIFRAGHHAAVQAAQREDTPGAVRVQHVKHRVAVQVVLVRADVDLVHAEDGLHRVHGRGKARAEHGHQGLARGQRIEGPLGHLWQPLVPPVRGVLLGWRLRNHPVAHRLAVGRVLRRRQLGGHDVVKGHRPGQDGVIRVPHGVSQQRHQQPRVHRQRPKPSLLALVRALVGGLAGGQVGQLLHRVPHHQRRQAVRRAARGRQLPRRERRQRAHGRRDKPHPQRHAREQAQRVGPQHDVRVGGGHG